MTAAEAAPEALASPQAAGAAHQPSRQAPHQPSLVRRLVVLQAVLSAVVLLAGGVALNAFFVDRSTAEFDDRLSQDIIDLVAGASVDDTGDVAAPALTDERTLQAYSGKYWEMIAVGAAADTTDDKTIGRSRSLWDAPDIALPANVAERLAASPGKPVFYDGVGPAPTNAPDAGPGAQAIRTLPMPGSPPRRCGSPALQEPTVFLVAEDRARRSTPTSATSPFPPPSRSWCCWRCW